MKFISKLSEKAIKNKLSPLDDLPWGGETPPTDKYWLPTEMISIRDTDEYKNLTEENKIKLSQLEFSLICSISASGEKEVVANMAKRMLKSKYKEFRKYFYHFIEEENNHIYMFSEFCEKYGKFFPILYPYVNQNMWKSKQIEDLLVFVHVLIFEELGQGLNECIYDTEDDIPILVKEINKYHILDESRHISFGKKLISEFAKSIKDTSSESEWRKLQYHILEYLETRHLDYFNSKIYKSVGIENALELKRREEKKQNIKFFYKGKKAERRIKNLITFLKKMELLPNKEI